MNLNGNIVSRNVSTKMGLKLGVGWLLVADCRPLGSTLLSDC